jgi:hypothetical protein
MEFLAKHHGQLGRHPGRRQENQFGSESSFRLLGSYRTAAANREWVITEMTRSHTTLSLPDEY